MSRRWRAAGPIAVFTLVTVFGVISAWQAWDVASHLEDEARQTSRIYGQIVAALNDPDPGASTTILLELVSQITESGIPLVLTDSTGRVLQVANLPFDSLDYARVAAIVPELDRVNPPIAAPTGGQVIHFGSLPVAGRLKWLGVLQLVLLATSLIAGGWAYRAAVHRDRDRLWVAMARESAHQLGTPLMSAGGWVDRLEASGGESAATARHLRADLERLHRVAQRFERIGKPAKRERVALGALAERVATYFKPRLPQYANQIALSVQAPASGPVIAGDSVLLEWALEALVRNAIDALSGRGGAITITVIANGTGGTLSVSDDGPGVAPDLRGRIFEPGVTSKPGGWGIGLALARRIVEDVHGGRLMLLGNTPGAVFRADLPGEAS